VWPDRHGRVIEYHVQDARTWQRSHGDADAIQLRSQTRGRQVRTATVSGEHTQIAQAAIDIAGILRAQHENGHAKSLEPFTVAGALTYGNYFEFSPATTYTADIEIRRPGRPEAVKTRFEYRHH